MQKLKDRIHLKEALMEKFLKDTDEVHSYTF